MRSFLTLSVCGLAIWASVPVQGQAGRTYTTNFPATENPISEGGNWRNGQREGIDWKDIRTVPGLAFGTQGGTPPPYDDSTAVLNGTWGPDQTVEAKVKTVNQNGSINQEVEIRLRTTINARSLSGYEVLYKVTHDGNQYHQIVRWHGPIGTSTCNWNCAFSLVPGSRDMRAGDGFPGVYDGDTIGASIVGNRITTWITHNGVKRVLQDIYDTSGPGGGAYFTSGSPGMGFWLRGPASTLADYGLTSFSATDAGALPPAPGAPNNLRIIRTALEVGGVPLFARASDALAILMPAVSAYTH